MKIKSGLVFCALFLLNSCLLKSLQPFYTEKSVCFAPQLVGEWTDDKDGTWEVKSFKKEWIKERTSDTSATKRYKTSLNIYKNGYIAEYTSKGKKSTFLLMPFKVNNQLFLDFSILDFNTDSVNNIASQHLLPTHSVAKVNFNDDAATIIWLTETVVDTLIEDKSITVAHQKTGMFEAHFIVTESSKTLEQLITKMAKYPETYNWGSKSKLVLKPTKKP